MGTAEEQENNWDWERKRYCGENSHQGERVSCYVNYMNYLSSSSLIGGYS